MTDILKNVDLCDPVDAYVRPIRSVLFIDDQFPTFADASVSSFKEAERARALWLECTKRGWLCDIDNSHDWASPERKQRLSACDLLVLDLHLLGQDNRPALAIIRGMACGEAPNLVVVYTADKRPDQAFLAVAAAARGVSAEVNSAELDSEIEEMAVAWSTDDILSFLQDRLSWMGTYTAACKEARLPVDRSAGKVLLERWISRSFGVSPGQRLVTIERIKCSDKRWFQCGNLFVVLISKPSGEFQDDEARAVLAGLESAISDWAPSWLACLIASTRRSVESGSFRDDVNLPPEPLQAGLLRYLRGSEDDEERERRAREVASHLLARRFGNAANEMSAHLIRRASLDLDPASAPNDTDQLLHLNAFLCSEPFARHHLRVGTVFRTKDAQSYWICVTPGCDMVPRRPKSSVNPWGAELHPMRPLSALRLEIRRGTEIADSLETAQRGRHIFFADPIQPSSQPIVAACFNTLTDDPNPRLEQMFARDSARVHNRLVQMQRCISNPENGDVVLESMECEVVSQLRAPYAERLAHVVGHHLSRIGVNFERSYTSEEADSDL